MPMNNSKIMIYTDGGAKPNPGAGGWAVVLLYGDARKELYGFEPQTTNNRMELTAAVRALEALKRPCEVEFHTDSQYLRKGITEWIQNWRRNGWMTSKKQPVENQHLWMRLYDLTQQHNIEWKWVRGHNGDELNEYVDKLATRAREQGLSSQ
jgi:ribonuclease HI